MHKAKHEDRWSPYGAASSVAYHGRGYPGCVGGRRYRGAPNGMNIYFGKSDSRMDDEQKIAGGQKESNLTTVDGQKIIGGITKGD